jgi:hypothetical protein
MSFQRKIVGVFQEKYDLTEQRKQEILETAKERKRFYTLVKRNIRVEPSSSRSAEMDFQEIQELKQKLEPSEKRIKAIEAKLSLLEFQETKQRLLNEVDILESMFHEVEWSIVKAEIYEVSQKTYAEALKTVFKTLSKQEQEKHYFPTPQDKIWNTLDWKPHADKLYAEARKGYYENMEKLLAKRKEDKKNE